MVAEADTSISLGFDLLYDIVLMIRPKSVPLFGQIFQPLTMRCDHHSTAPRPS